MARAKGLHLPPTEAQLDRIHELAVTLNYGVPTNLKDRRAARDIITGFKNQIKLNKEQANG